IWRVVLPALNLPTLYFSQPPNSKVEGAMRASVKSQELGRTNCVDHDIRVLVIGDVVGPETKCQPVIFENETALTVYIELKEGWKPTGVDLTNNTTFHSLNGKRESAMLLQQVSDSPFFPGRRQICPTEEAVGSVPGHWTHVVGDQKRVFNIEV